MRQCAFCGKKGFFLALDFQGYCPGCSRLYMERMAQKRAAEAAKVERETIKVAGTSYRQDAIKKLGTENDDYSLTKKELSEYYEDEFVYALDFDCMVKLVPEPENEHDKNAIKVECDGVHIGYIPKGKTKHIKELMDSGRIKSMSIDIRGGKYKRVSDGEMDRGDHDFRADLLLDVWKEKPDEQE